MNLLKIVEDFKNGNDKFDGVQLVAKVKENENYDTYYTISFSASEEYRDIFLSAGLIYKDDCSTMIECVDGHEDDYYSEIEKGLYEKMNALGIVDILDLGVEYKYGEGCLDFESINAEEIKIQ